MKQRSLSAIIVILVMSLSVYFSAGAQALSSTKGPLTIYHLSPDGKITVAQINAFTEGDPIWISVPQGSSAPYFLSIDDQNGSPVVTKRDGFLPTDNLLPLSLDPSSFKPNQSYQVTLEVSRATLPGMYAAQLYGTTLLVLPARAYLSSENFSRNNGQTSISVRLADARGNPKTGVRLEVSLTQGSMSLPITTEKTDAHGRVVYSFSEALAAGQYQYEVNELDDGISATPIQLPQFVVEPRSSTLDTWSLNGVLQAALLEPTTGTPIGGRLLVLQHALNDGNWTIVSTTYTDDKGMASFPMPASPWGVSFNGDTFYSKSSSQVFTNPPPAQVPPNQALAVPTSTTFVGTTFNNGHITIEISTRDIAVYDPSGHTLLGHIRWEVQVLQSNSWKSISWDAPMSMGIDDLAGQHRITLQGTVGNGSLAVSMYLDARAQDAPFTPLLMPVQLAALRGTGSYRLVWHLDTNTPTSFQFEQRTGDHRTLVAGPVTTGSSLNQSPSIENSLVAMAPDAKTVLIGINWDGAKSYYQGATITTTPTGGSTAVTFGTFLLSSGQSFVLPACPCPDGGGGGGGGGTVPTTTTTIVPSSAYATVPAILSARVRDTNGNPIANGYVWWVDNSSRVLGNAITNSTGYAKMVWTAGAAASQSINADYAGDSTYAPSYGSILTLNVGQTPTTIELLQPQQIAYSWDLYNYYSGAGRPIVVPVNILTLAASNNTSETSVYTPAYSGPSTIPPHISGYGWAGLNQSSAVTITMNTTYSQTQNMNWTRNFYLPPCPNPPNCSTNPRTGHMFLTASLAPPSTLYSVSSTSLNMPYQNVNSVSNPLAIDNSAIASCPHYTPGCSINFSTSQRNDIIIVYTHESLDLYTYSCSFAVSDRAGLSWMQRGNTVLNRFESGGYRDQFAEFWARSINPLSSDNITETCNGGDGYNGFQVFGISGANFNNPFDPNTSLPGSLAGTGYGTSVTVSTTDPYDMIISGVQHSAAPVPTPGPGFTTITVTGGISTEYEIATAPLVKFNVTFGANISSYWEQIADAVQPAQPSQVATPPSHLYVGVNSTYPYISIKMQDVPIALEAYVAYLAHTLGPPLSSTVQCPSSCFNYYALPVQSSTKGSDFAYACTSSACAIPATSAVLNLYNSQGQLCLSTTTDYQGIAHLNLAGSTGCTYPYYYLGTPSTTIVLSELFGIEAVSNPYPFYTNFQGYNYAIYAPQQVGRYLLHMHTYYQSSAFTIINPTTSYSDVQQAYLTCCDIFLTVEKHPTTMRAGVTPSMATVNDNVNASITLTDQAKAKGMQNVSVSYSLKRNDPNPTTLTSGAITTGPNGNTTLTLGKLAYGGYTLTVSWAGNSTAIASSYQANFTIWRARTIIIISPGWIRATAGNQYLFTSTLIDNATRSVIAVSGLVEQVYINGALYSNTELCSTSGCSVANYYLTNPGGNVTFPWKANGAGQYFINATFPQQSYYPPTSFQIEASVTLRPVVLVAANSPFQPNTNDPVTWTIQAYDLLDNASIAGLSITPYINGSSYPAVITDTTGHATFPNTFTAPGFYNVAFSSAATTVYNSATTQNSLKVFTPTTLTISGGTVYLGLQNSLSVTLKDNIGNPLGGRTVQINVNGAPYTTVTTGSNGQASFNWQPTSLGNYTVAASYSPTGPSDAGFKPSSASVMVNIRPLTVVNTQSTGSGTQSVTLNGAQGSAATGGALSYSFQFSPSSATVTLQLNGRQSQASVNMWNEFGWTCVARVFGTCVLSVPFLKIHVDMGVPNVFDLHVASFVPIGPPSVSQDVNTSPQADLVSEALGTAASFAIALVGTTIIVAGGGPLDLGAVAAAGLVNSAGLDIALLAAMSAYLLGTMSRDGLKSFIQGLIVPVMAGAACALLFCQVDLPALPPPYDLDIAAVGAWAVYWTIGVIIPFALEGWIALFAIGVVLILAGLIYSGL